MQTNPSHFIEQVNHEGRCNMLSMQPISLTEKFNVNVVAVFKIYPKLKPMIAQYDTEVKSILIE